MIVVSAFWASLPRDGDLPVLFMFTAREMTITGLVQGVGFRWTARRIAESEGVSGWVRNNPDGSVGLAVEGPEESVERFMERLNEALGGYIDRIESRAAVPGNGGGFVIIR